jgi:glycosyltransferase involved in cell wall biosynthesis
MPFESPEVAFSIIMPVLNGEKYIEEAIRSVVSQTFKCWELLVIDDGSSDATLPISYSWKAKESRIRILQHIGGINKGVSASRNLGISSSTGKWIAFLDADDLWLPQKLEREYKILESAENISLLYSIARVEDERGAGLKRQFYGQGKEGLIRDPFLKVLKGFQGHISSVIVQKKTIADNNLKFNEGMKFSEDTLFFHEVLQYGNIFFIPETLSIYRFNSSSSTTKIDSAEKVLGRISVYEHLLTCASPVYRKSISFQLINTGMESVWRYFWQDPSGYLSLIRAATFRILRNRKVNTLHKIYLLTEPFPVIIKGLLRRMF